jgi:hypothetical protein
MYLPKGCIELALSGEFNQVKILSGLPDTAALSTKEAWFSGSVRNLRASDFHVFEVEQT